MQTCSVLTCQQSRALTGATHTQSHCQRQHRAAAAAAGDAGTFFLPRGFDWVRWLQLLGMHGSASQGAILVVRGGWNKTKTTTNRQIPTVHSQCPSNRPPIGNIPLGREFHQPVHVALNETCGCPWCRHPCYPRSSRSSLKRP